MVNLLNSSNANNVTVLQHKHLEDHIVSNANNFNTPPASSPSSKSNSSAQTIKEAANLTSPTVTGREESHFHYQPTPTVRIEPPSANNQTQNAQLIPNINKNNNTLNSLESTLASLIQKPKPSSNNKQNVTTSPTSSNLLDQTSSFSKQQSSNIAQLNPVSNNNKQQNISSNLDQTLNLVKKSNSTTRNDEANKIFTRTLQDAFQKNTLSIDAVEKQFNRHHMIRNDSSTITHVSHHPEISLRSLIEKNNTLLDQIDDFIETELDHRSAVIVPQSNSDRRDCYLKGDNCSLIIEDESVKQNEETPNQDETIISSNISEKEKDKIDNHLTVESPSSTNQIQDPEKQQNPLNQNEAALPVARKLISKLLEEPPSPTTLTNREVFKPTPSIQKTAQLRSGGLSAQPRFDNMETILEMAKIGTIALKLAKNAALSPLGSPDTLANAAKAFVTNTAEKLPVNQAVVVEKQFFPKEKKEEDATKLVEKSMQVSPSIDKQTDASATVEKQQALDVPSKPSVVETKKEEQAFPTVADDSGLYGLFYL